MGKKQKVAAVRKKADTAKFFRDFEEECSGSGINKGSVDGTEHSSSPLDDYAAALKVSTKELVQSSPKSLSYSRTLGEYDTVSEGSSEKCQPVKEGNQEGDNSGANGLKAPWVSLFKDNRKPSQCLALEVFENLPEQIVFDGSVEDDLEMVWGYCLVGYFAGRFPGKKALLNLCASWNVKYEYHTHSSGWLVFKFEDDASRERVLNGGPYFVFGRPLLLKVMPKCFEFDDEEISKIPVWVMLPGLPLNYWNPKGLGMIASKIGKPLSMDNLTHTKGRLSYARILVEVDASVELVRSVSIRLSSGKDREQSVVFEHEPKYCPTCRMFGHSLVECTMIEKSFQVGMKVAEPKDGEQNSSIPPVDKEAALVTSENLDTTGSENAGLTTAANPVAAIEEESDQLHETRAEKNKAHNVDPQPPVISEVYVEDHEYSEEVHDENNFILVETKKKRSKKIKQKLEESLYPTTLKGQCSASHHNVQQRAGVKYGKSKDIHANKVHKTTTLDKLKGPTLPLSQ
ncbi:Uncharacterized protein Adt_35241 [Abeliophyllum distichum]|uniref:DUF4283 domain-containing protein n=1 Tax=Abeliophyllum distichum TaxID=126358 RepID=A0ABD1QE52_9LAMI